MLQIKTPVKGDCRDPGKEGVETRDSIAPSGRSGHQVSEYGGSTEPPDGGGWGHDGVSGFRGGESFEAPWRREYQEYEVVV